MTSHSSYQLRVQRCHTGSLKSVMGALFTPWKSKSALNSGHNQYLIVCVDLREKENVENVD